MFNIRIFFCIHQKIFIHKGGIWLVLYTIISLFLLIIFYLAGQKSTLFKKGTIILFLFFNLIYLGWRTFYTVPSISILSVIAGILLLITEWGGFLQSFVFGILFWTDTKRNKKWLADLERLPTVDIFVATYNEPLDLLKRMIVACQLIDYPDKHLIKIYICDDGNRDEVRDLCQKYGVIHVTRSDNKHAKAGNLNHALTVSDGEVVVTLDADMIPRKNFLQKTMGYFSDERVGFIQAPQAFFNDDPFQFNLFAEERIINEQDFFMRKLEEKKDHYNATMYIGSNALFKRTTLDSVNGFATGVITEDMATGMLIQAKGWKTVFVNEVLAVGLAPETYKDLIKQRDRWCRGNIQVMKKWNIFTLKGLSWMQKLLYIDGIHYWFFGVYKMIFLLAPLLYLLFHVYSLQASFVDLLYFWLPAFFSSQLFFNLVSDKKRTVMWSNVYEIALAPSMAYAALSELFLKKKKKFHVTRKGVQTDQRYFLFKTSFVHLFLLLLSLISLVKILLFWIRPDLVEFNPSSLYINIFWLLYNILCISIAILVAVERPRYRSTERFPVFKHGLLDNLASFKTEVKVQDLNEFGARLSTQKSNLVDSLEHIHLTIDGYSFYGIVKWVIDKNDSAELGIQFQKVPPESYSYVISTVYSTPQKEKDNRGYGNSSLLYTFFNFLFKTEKKPESHKRLTIRERSKLTGEFLKEGTTYPFSVIDASVGGYQIKTKAKLNVGEIISLQLPNFEKPVQVEIRWQKRRVLRTYAGSKILRSTN